MSNRCAKFLLKDIESLKTIQNYTEELHLVSQKRHPFYFRDIFVRCHPILVFFGREFATNIYAQPPVRTYDELW